MLRADQGTRAGISPEQFVPGGLVIQAQGWRSTSPPSSEPRTPPRALYPSACCRMPSNFPTIQGVQNRNEIAPAAELAITSTPSGL